LASGRVSNPRAYLFRAATNAVHNLRRSRGREQVRVERYATRDMASGEPDTSDVRAALIGLSPRQRAVLYLAYWEDQTEAAIAEQLGLRVGTVRRHVHRALEHLRKVLR
jgi:RNA polymerase sigma factor (sigma-70 family)